MKGKIIIPKGMSVWPHEFRVAKILATTNHVVEFLPTRSIKTADILLDGVEFEIKSPITNRTDKLERVIKRALRQSRNIIYDSARIKNLSDDKLCNFLIHKARMQPQIRKLLLITKDGRVIDIKNYV